MFYRTNSQAYSVQSECSGTTYTRDLKIWHRTLNFSSKVHGHSTDDYLLRLATSNTFPYYDEDPSYTHEFSTTLLYSLKTCFFRQSLAPCARSDCNQSKITWWVSTWMQVAKWKQIRQTQIKIAYSVETKNSRCREFVLSHWWGSFQAKKTSARSELRKS